jgi:hypothetical protein
MFLYLVLMEFYLELFYSPHRNFSTVLVNTQFMANSRFWNMVNSEKDSNATSPITKCDNPNRIVNGQPEQLQVTSS